jgi:2,3-bisphosphoglycerate-dependent phosphoglycerate mutase
MRMSTRSRGDGGRCRPTGSADPKAGCTSAIRWRGGGRPVRKTGSLTTLYLIRHAQALPRPEQSEPDWLLSPLGEDQARKLLSVLAPLGIQRLYSSPYRRCRETLAPFAEAAGLDLALDAGLRERRIASVWMSDFRETWRRSWEDFSYALDGGESSWTCRERIAAAIELLVARHAGETIALGSHGNSIGLFMNYVDPAFGLPEATRIRTPDILKVVHRDGRFVWDRSFAAGAAFDALATDFRATPGVIA